MSPSPMISESRNPAMAHPSRRRRAVVVLFAAAAVLALLSAPVAVAAANVPVTPEHGQGLLPSAGLPKGVSPALAGVAQDAAPLPASVDLSAWDPPVGNQGSLNSCASWVTGYYYRYWLRNHITGETSTFAPMFLYSQITHGTDSGSSIGDNVALLQAAGIPHATDYSQGPLDYRTQPTTAESQAAAPYRATSGSFLMFDTGVGTEAQTAIEASLAAGRPVILSFPLYQNFIAANSSNYFVDVPPAGSTEHGYHGVFVPKYDAQGVWVENSWGTGWGRAGWAELSWAFVNQYSAEGWTMSADDKGALALSAPTSPSVPGTAQTLTLTAKTPTGETATAYRGTVHFTSSDPAAILPSDYTFTAADAGVQTFSVTLETAGIQSVTATDKADGSIAGTQSASVGNTGSRYHALAPARILDSRDGTGGLSGALSSHAARTFQVTGRGGVPADATAVTGNLTVTQQTSAGFLYVGPNATDNPTSSTLNFPETDDRANAVTVAVGVGGTLSVTYAAPSYGPTAQVVFDVTGYFTASLSGAKYFPVGPARILDTRYGTGLSGVFDSHVARTFQVAGQAGVPVGATAVTGNLTVTQQTSLGYLFIGPVAMDNPTSSTLNFPRGDDAANAVTVALGTGGTLSVTYAAPMYGPTAHVMFDVTGYFMAGTGGDTYMPLTPARLLDTRYATGGLAGPFGTRAVRAFQVAGHGGVAAAATAVTGNLTVTAATSAGYVTVGATMTASPTTSSLNMVAHADRANGVTVALSSAGSLGAVWCGTAGSTADVIFDVTGYFMADPTGL
jgi:hypothetical protein